MKKQRLLNGITNDIAPTLLAGYYKYGVATLITGNFGTSGGAILEIETMQELIAEPKIAASRGRGEFNQQHLEINDSGTSNTITSVNKATF